jgi:hypothetical protein
MNTLILHQWTEHAKCGARVKKQAPRAVMLVMRSSKYRQAARAPNVKFRDKIGIFATTEISIRYLIGYLC